MQSFHGVAELAERVMIKFSSHGSDDENFMYKKRNYTI